MMAESRETNVYQAFFFTAMIQSKSIAYTYYLHFKEHPVRLLAAHEEAVGIGEV